MLIEITKLTRTRETIDVSFPHYFKQDLLFDGDFIDSTIYGKITEAEVRTIQITQRSDDNVEVKFERNTVDFERIGCYFDGTYSSTAEEYENARAVALKEILPS